MSDHIVSYPNHRQRANLTARSHTRDTTARFQKQDGSNTAKPDSRKSCPGMDPNTVRTRADETNDPDLLRWIWRINTALLIFQRLEQETFLPCSLLAYKTHSSQYANHCRRDSKQTR